MNGKSFVFLTGIFLFSLIHPVFGQNIDFILKEASVLDRQFKEVEALEKFRQIVAINPQYIPALVRCTELSCTLGDRETNETTKQQYFLEAKKYASKALSADSENADANYAMGIVYGQLARIEKDKKTALEYVKRIKFYADRAIAIEANHSKATYLLGVWHYKIVTLSWAKKLAVKAIFGGMPEASLNEAIRNFEKTRTLDPYFVENYLYLAKAYEEDNQPAKQIEVLQKMVRLPNRTYDDASYKATGREILQKLQ